MAGPYGHFCGMAGTKTSLESHNQSHDHENVNYPNHPDEMVYAQ